MSLQDVSYVPIASSTCQAITASSSVEIMQISSTLRGELIRSAVALGSHGILRISRDDCGRDGSLVGNR